MASSITSSGESDDVYNFIQNAISSWLGIDWASLERCPSKSGAGLIGRCDRLPPPPLAQWCRTLPQLKWTAKGDKSGQKTWCLLCDRRQATAPTGEVALERKLVVQPNEGWWAQIPTSSGFNVRGATKRSIDLVQEIRKDEFRFIELKINPRTNNPIYAAIELIVYGIFYSLIRRNPDLRSKLHEGSSRLLDASAVEFAVFAPWNYYTKSLPTAEDKVKLLRFGKKLSDAVADLGSNTVRLSFAFRVFDEAALRADIETVDLRYLFKEAKELGDDRSM